MKASELIKSLESGILEHGDYEVLIPDVFGEGFNKAEDIVCTKMKDGPVSYSWALKDAGSDFFFVIE